MTSIRVKPKKRGRPKLANPKERDPLIAVRFPAEQIAQIDAYADANELDRSKAVRELVDIGLETSAKRKPKR